MEKLCYQRYDPKRNVSKIIWIKENNRKFRSKRNHLKDPYSSATPNLRIYAYAKNAYPPTWLINARYQASARLFDRYFLD